MKNTSLVNKNRGIVKWAGGKQRILQEILSLFPASIENYYEPFCGGGSIFMNLQNFQYDNKYISDGNSYLINLYLSIRDNPLEVIEVLKGLAIQDSKEFYLKSRKSFPSLSGIEQAAMFLYINRTCFNGIYRENSKGDFNVPYGSEVSFDTIVQEENLLKVSGLTQDINFSCFLFDDFCKMVSGKEDFSNCFFYFDPPYYNTFSGYLKDVFSEESHVELSKLCELIDTKGGKFVLSNSNEDFVRNLYSKFEIKDIEVKRSISAKTESRKKINEIVVYN